MLKLKYIQCQNSVNLQVSNVSFRKAKLCMLRNLVVIGYNPTIQLTLLFAKSLSIKKGIAYSAIPFVKMDDGFYFLSIITF